MKETGVLMKNCYVLLSLALVITVSGCSRPRLAARPFTAQELFWAENMQNWYEDWQPPYYSPVQADTPVLHQPQEVPSMLQPFEPGLQPLPAFQELPAPFIVPPVLSESETGESVSVPPPPASRTYTVQKGDNLNRIARQIYGDPAKARVIFEANRDIISSPDRILPGMILNIPAEN